MKHPKKILRVTFIVFKTPMTGLRGGVSVGKITCMVHRCVDAVRHSGGFCRRSSSSYFRIADN